MTDISSMVLRQQRCMPAFIGISRVVALAVLFLSSGCATTKTLYDARGYVDSMEELYEREDLARAELLLGQQMKGVKATETGWTSSDCVSGYICFPYGGYLLYKKGFPDMQDSIYTDGPRVPPGAYADYGFLLFRRGDSAGGLTYFEKEMMVFPESAIFMDKVIGRAKKMSLSANEKESVNKVTEEISITDEASDEEGPSPDRVQP